MATRYWKAKWHSGYAGTDSEEDIDLVEMFGLTEEEVAAMSDEDASEKVADWAWEQATEACEGWGEPVE